MVCPSCYSSNIAKNGSIHNGKPKFCCKNCGRQFVENPENRISQDKKDLIDKLLLERIPLAGIARVVGVSERWLQSYVNRKYQEVPRTVDVKKKPKANW
jgi:insertion element IS1 protein InsB